jgi:hypothetical protein
VIGEALVSGRPENGWPGWVTLGPILLRSAGIVGIAGVIMVIAAGDALFPGQSGPVRDADSAADAATVASRGATQETAKKVTLVPISAAPSEVAPAPKKGDAPAFAALPDSEASMRGRFGDFDPRALWPQSPQPDAPAATAELDAAAVPVARKGDLPTEMRRATPAGEPAPAAAPAPGGEPASGSGTTVGEALAPAAAEEAMLLATGFAARIPAPRPDPPPVVKPTRASRRGNSSWPGTPPPNCGKKHAFWHYVDRKRDIKEWYCR